MEKEEAWLFDWDPDNREHIARHRVSPEEVESALIEEPLDVNHEVVDGESRWTSVGHTKELRVLLIVWTMRNEAVRPITARDVGRSRRIQYLRIKGFSV